MGRGKASIKRRSFVKCDLGDENVAPLGKDETREGYERERAIWQKETYLPAQSGMITIWRDEAARVSQVPSKVQTEILEYNFHSI